MSGRPPLLIQQVRHVLRARGYADTLSWDEATVLFGEYVGYYFSGLTTNAFLAALADELLIRLVKRSGGKPKHDLFDILLTTSMVTSASSTQEHARYRKRLQQFYDVT